MEKVSHNENYGKYFGYPQCCIDAYGDRKIFFFTRPEIVQKATVQGFVPCEKHAKQLLDGEITYTELINTSARICPIGFKITDDTRKEAEYIQIHSDLYIMLLEKYI
jgi:hypothetical protein